MRTTHTFLRLCFALAFASTVVRTDSAQAQTSSGSASESAYRSESAALWWSLGGTVVPMLAGVAVAAPGPTDEWAAISVLLMTGGLVAGPSFGHFYSGRSGYALAMMGVRTAVAFGFGALAISSCPGFEDCTDSEEARFAAFFFGGSVILGGLAVYDIVTAPASARRYNDRIDGLSVIPVVSPWGDLAIRMRLTF